MFVESPEPKASVRNLNTLGRVTVLQVAFCPIAYSKMLGAYTRVGFPLASRRILFSSTTPVFYNRCYASKSNKHSSKDQTKATKARLKSSKFDGEKHGTVSTDQLLP